MVKYVYEYSGGESTAQMISTSRLSTARIFVYSSHFRSTCLPWRIRHSIILNAPKSLYAYFELILIHITPF
jgi:hypothetical protein